MPFTPSRTPSPPISWASSLPSASPLLASLSGAQSPGGWCSKGCWGRRFWLSLWSSELLRGWGCRRGRFVGGRKPSVDCEGEERLAMTFGGPGGLGDLGDGKGDLFMSSPTPPSSRLGRCTKRLKRNRPSQHICAGNTSDVRERATGWRVGCWSASGP